MSTWEKSGVQEEAPKAGGIFIFEHLFCAFWHLSVVQPYQKNSLNCENTHTHCQKLVPNANKKFRDRNCQNVPTHLFSEWILQKRVSQLKEVPLVTSKH